MEHSKRTDKNGHPVETFTFYSLDEWADFALETWEGMKEKDGYEHSKIGFERKDWTESDSIQEAAELCRNGWQKGLTDAMPVAEDALDAIEDEVETLDMEPVWDVTGTEVDVGKFVQGVPECMVDYPLTKTSKAGKVVTLNASGCYSGSLTTEAVMKRGAAITGLALALERSAHETELWIDLTTDTRKDTRHGNGRIEIRVLVKGVNDVVDPSKIAFAYGHPSVLRRLGFATMWAADPDTRTACRIPLGYGRVADGFENDDLPEEAIRLPGLETARDIPDADKFVHDHLKNLGLLKEAA